MIKRFAQRLFRWFCHPDYYDEIVGDLEEMYQRNKDEELRFVQWKYFFQVIGLFRPSLIRSFPHIYLTQPAMFRHYFNISTRVLLRHKFYSAINILGLAVGMGVALLIYQYIHFELSYDKFHEDAENIYRLTQTTIRNGENLGTGVYTTYGLGPTAKAEIPGVETFVRVYPDDIGMTVINPESDEKYQEQEGRIWYVDSAFLEMFSFPLKQGLAKTSLNEQHNILLTEAMAIKYFGDSNPLGKTIEISAGVLSGSFTVSGVLEALPANTHLQFDFLLPIDYLLSRYGPFKNHDDGWDWERFVTYIQTNDEVQADNLNEKLDQLVSRHVGEGLSKSDSYWKIGLQPLTDIHLRSNFPKDLASSPGNIQNVRFFAMIGLFILMMAWVNYINLSTAHAMQRAKEVGVRKTIGALKNQLISQFMVESCMINLTAGTIAIGIAYFSLPVLNNIIGIELTFNVLQIPEFWAAFFLIILFGTLLSGIYPSFVLPSFNPLKVLKFITISPGRGFSLRKGLIAFQFLMSVLLISGTYLVYQQITFMKDQDLGFELERILIVNGPRVAIQDGQEALISLFETFETEVLQHHTITSISGTSHIPGRGYMGGWNARKLGEPESAAKEGMVIFTDSYITDTYDMKYLAKRELPAEISNYEWLILNEEAVKTYGLGSPEEALNKHLLVFGDTLKILGIVENIHWSSLKTTHLPILFTVDRYYGAYFSIKMNMSDIDESIAHIEDAYQQIYPDDPFQYFFLDDAFNRQYQADLQFRNLFSAFSALAIFIACIGLFALVSYSATLRIKEIGIRKVLGAGVGHLMILLSREYLILLLIAIGLAVPAIIIGGKAWLENYAYKVGLGIDLFLIPGLILLLISFLTVSYKTFASARANPVEALKSE
ncbi:putative ABC transport system permease protein [Catalinimonas alkaloidigena]|uniref:ABC transporter permease n=1 Tax=Catalinimonas alkaloidigena TaxID=1075417 RepID=UPI002406FD10|nr:ABC transporter permease [Catalinimonas alkaloidigena]MDF9796582.1 putative ABC transport system permease protein [Catalinimonas alkaloidigena]